MHYERMVSIPTEKAFYKIEDPPVCADPKTEFDNNATK